LPEQDVNAVRRYFDAVGRFDMPAVLDCLDREVELQVPEGLPFGGTYNAHEGVLNFFGATEGSWEEFEVHGDEFLDAGDYVVVRGHIHGRGAGGLAQEDFVELFKLRDGKIRWMRYFEDTVKVVQALGQTVST
jgi:uncharacterized protein